MRAPIQYNLDTDPQFPGYPWLLREVCTARDRYLTYVKARRFANNGGLVICDRFPLLQIRLMEGAQAERMTGSCPPNRWIKFLARLEKQYYEPILPPELLIVLKVDPAIAVQRKPDEDPTSVRARATEIWNLDWQQTGACVIDASQPKAQVLSRVKALVWSQL